MQNTLLLLAVTASGMLAFARGAGRMKLALSAALIILLTVPATSGVATANHTQKIAIPSYFYPGSLWTQMEQAVPTVSTAIINPASGPGPNQNPDYVNQVQKSQAAGLSVLGYVHTSYGARSIEAVKTEINNHYEWYGVNGIFLDEASTDCSLASSYYNELYNHIKAKGGSAVVVLNPGTQTNECYTNVSDVLLTFEGTYNTYSSRYSAPSWVSRYPPSRFWHLVYSTSNTRAMERAVSLSKQRGAGWVYVTPDNLPNPWDTLPSGSYWSKELSAVQKV